MDEEDGTVRVYVAVLAEMLTNDVVVRVSTSDGTATSSGIYRDV